MKQIYNAMEALDSIDGILSELSSLSDRPQGYPFSKIIIYSTNLQLQKLLPYLPFNTSVKDAAELTFMQKKLDFRKAGKILGSKTNQVKEMLARGEDISEYNLPEDCIIASTKFPIIKEQKRRTTGCCQFLICVEDEECPELWEVIKFRRAVKKYITEDLNLHIVPPIFGDKYPEKNNDNLITRVNVRVLNCAESLYQALETYGKMEFASLPIRLTLPSRGELMKGLKAVNRHHLPMAIIEITY